MCGIIGVFKKRNILSQSDRDWANSGVDKLAHRGPDAKGYFENDYCCFGHRRLSIIDTSDASNQPFESKAYNSALVFNGEIYNYEEIADKSKLSSFRGDTDVLFHLLNEKSSLIESVRGMYAYAYVNNESLTISRDPVGIKPFYYLETDDSVYFSSEIRPLTIFAYRFDQEDLEYFFRFQSNSDDSTVCSSIKRLFPGETKVYSRATSGVQIERRSVFTKSHQPKILSRSTALKEIQTSFQKAVERRLIADVPVGLFLSGGIDSSAIAVQIAQQGANNVTAITLGFDESSHDERDSAARLAKDLDLKHCTIKLTEEQILEDTITAVDKMDYPSADAINTFIVSKYARANDITVCLSGLGGDELFHGYPASSRYYLQHQRLKLLKNLGADKFLSMLPSLNLNFDKLSDLLQSELDPDDFVSSARTVFPSSFFVNPINFIETSHSKTKEPSEDLTNAELYYYTIPLLLNDADQMSMANSIELRVPFLDIDLISTVQSIHENIRNPLQYSSPKGLFIEAMSGKIPSYIFQKKKQGFALPMARWMRGPLKSELQNWLQFGHHEQWLKSQKVENLISQFFKGEDDRNWSRVWLIAMFNKWVDKNRRLRN